MVGADALVADKGELQYGEVYKLDSSTYKFVYFTTSLYAISKYSFNTYPTNPLAICKQIPAVTNPNTLHDFMLELRGVIYDLSGIVVGPHR